MTAVSNQRRVGRMKLANSMTWNVFRENVVDEFVSFELNLLKPSSSFTYDQV
jgi:hypothetical protein